MAEEVKPVLLDGWPTTPNQAVVHLVRPSSRLLEIGCGRGELLATLAPHFDEVVGTDISSLRVERTRQALANLPNCRILNKPLEEVATLNLPPFDCIVWVDVLEHIVDVIGAMQIIAHLSHPGTLLITVTPNVAFFLQRLRLLFGFAPVTSWLHPNEGFTKKPRQTVLHDAGHLHYLTFRQVEILYQLAGFRPKQRLGFASRFSRQRNYWPTLLSSSVCISGTYEGLDTF